MTDFVRFPRTPHLEVLGTSEVRGDKVLTPGQARAFLAEDILVEEKIDGENLGISYVDGQLRCQSRGSYVEPGGVHFRGLSTWLTPRQDRIIREIGADLVIFGEWCAITHSVVYEALPDWLLVFDVYDRRTRAFWQASERNLLADAIGSRVVPLLAAGGFDLTALRQLMGPSQFGAPLMEGLILRHVDRPGERAKLVDPGFLQAIGEHWQTGRMLRNRLSSSIATS